jgi:hypothetical protein
MTGLGFWKPKSIEPQRSRRRGRRVRIAELSGQASRSISKPDCESGITFVASGLPTFCGLALAKNGSFA